VNEADPIIGPEGAPRKPGERLHVFLGTSAAVLVLDLLSKMVVFRTLTLGHEPIPIIGQALRLIYIHNPGSSFGLFHGNRWFFIGVSALSILVILSLALKTRYRSRSLQVALGMILGGAVGNLVDRIWLGEVIDFIEMGIGRHRWPVYNVADIGITLGVAILALILLTQREESADPGPQESKRDPDPAAPERSR
jgi:signal peptidase II